MARSLTMGPCTAILAIGMACLSSSAQGNPTTEPRPFYFPPVPQQQNYPAKKKTPAKQDKTASPQAPQVAESPKSTQTPEDGMTTQQFDLLLGPIDQSQFQPDPNLGLFTLDVVVRDQQGRSVAGLGEKDFTLLDNGQPRDIVTFQAFDNAASRPAPPVEIILVIDEVDLPAEFLNEVKQAVQKFLQQNDGYLAQPTKVYRITNDGLFVSSQPSKDGNALAREVAQRKEARMIWSADELGLTIVAKGLGISGQRSIPNAGWTELPHPLIALGSIAIEERRTPERKLLFWFGNGWPTKQNSRWQHLFDTVTELSTRLREARIGIWVDDYWRRTGADDFKYQDYLAGATSEKSLTIENVALQVLTAQSGGGMLRGVGDAGIW